MQQVNASENGRIASVEDISTMNQMKVPIARDIQHGFRFGVEVRIDDILVPDKNVMPMLNVNVDSIGLEVNMSHANEIEKHNGRI